MKTDRTFELYEDAGGKWRWRLKSANGAIVGVSGESFDSASNAEAAVQREAQFYKDGSVQIVKESK